MYILLCIFYVKIKRYNKKKKHIFFFASDPLVISRRALAREGDYEMMPVCSCVRACVRVCVR